MFQGSIQYFFSRNTDTDIEPRRKPTRCRKRTREATKDATNILDEVEAVADKAAVADVIAVNVGAEMIATEATTATAETARVTSRATAVGRRATSSQNAQREVKNVDSAARWAICR